MLITNRKDGTERERERERDQDATGGTLVLSSVIIKSRKGAGKEKGRRTVPLCSVQQQMKKKMLRRNTDRRRREWNEGES